MNDARSRRRTQSAVRAVTAGLCVVFAVLAGVALWGAIAADRSAARLTHSGDLVEAYLDLTHAVAVQDWAEEELADDLDDGGGRVQKSTLRRFDEARRSVVVALDVLKRLGDPADRELRARIIAYQRRYVQDIRRFFVALQAGDAKAAAEAEEAADPSSQMLQGLVSQGGPRQASRSLREVDALRRSQAGILRFTVVSVLLGTGAIFALWLVLRSLRRRIDDAREAELSRLESAALTDSLTDMRNHRAFEEDLVKVLAQRRRHESPLSLAVIDLDGLKAINDAHGHKAGDRAIRVVAEVLTATLRSSDWLYRVGGDEFAVLLPGNSGWEAFHFAQRLHETLAAEHPGVQVSVGVAEATDVSTRDELIGQADIALLEAKAGGRDTVLFVPGMARPDLIDADDENRHRGSLAAALARAVDAKDTYTRSHSETVAELCAIIAANLGLDPEHVASIRLAGLVHDVGKIGVPDAILQKPSRLEDHEYAIIKTHATLGHKILHGTDLSREAPWVLHHHERLDGGGYPGGLLADEIALESRIIHVADAYEAMTSDRPYRRGMPQEAALAELERHAGTQFDPACVKALLDGLGASTARPAVAAEL